MNQFIVNLRYEKIYQKFLCMNYKRKMGGGNHHGLRKPHKTMFQSSDLLISVSKHETLNITYNS